jgi:hypothetical protein
MAWLKDEAERIVAAGNMKFGESGPFLVQRLVKEQKLQNHVAAWYEFCPYPWRMIQRMAYVGWDSWLKDQVRLLKHVAIQACKTDFKAGYVRHETRALHLHNEIWKASGIHKDERYHPWCLYERLKRRHGIR